MCSRLKIFTIKCYAYCHCLKEREAFQMNTSRTSKEAGVVCQAPVEQVRSGVLPSFSLHSFLLVHFEVSWLNCHSFTSSWERLSRTSEEVLMQKPCVPLQGRPSAQLGTLGCQTNPGEPALCPVLQNGTCQMPLMTSKGWRYSDKTAV